MSSARPLKPCGTPAAYHRHLKRRQVPCEKCVEAIREAATRKRREQGIPERGPLKPCGTPAAYKRHIAHGQEPCEDCRQARRDYENDRALRANEQTGES